MCGCSKRRRRVTPDQAASMNGQNAAANASATNAPVPAAPRPAGS